MRLSTLVLSIALAVTTSAYAGAPLKGVDVKLGKNPGGTPAARTTNEQGTFDFGVVPKGSYTMTFALHDGKGHAPADPATCSITIRNGGAPIETGWDFRQGRRFNPATERAAKATAEETVAITSDGQHPIQGTIVKSKSNISNN